MGGTMKFDTCVMDEDGNLIPASFEEWARFMEGPQRIIQQEEFMDGRYRVSTVFLGLDHSHGLGRKLYFETMVFGPEREVNAFGQSHMLRASLWQERCETLAEAKELHEIGLRWLREQVLHTSP